MKMAKLYAVGIGPGDPELLTLKARRLLTECGVVLVPRGSESGESLALSIAGRAVDLSGKKIIQVHFPMKKGPQREALLPVARELLEVLRDGRDVVFITLGDPVLFSTFFHLLDAVQSLCPDVPTEIVPGVTSVTAAGAAAGISLALSNERVAVIPATYHGGEGFKEVLRNFDTIVLMKVYKVIEALTEELERAGLMDSAHYISKVGLPGEVIKPLKDVEPGDLNYFSMVIVRKPNGG